eukprot:TRINITY_DN10471_c0_g1_i1.p1 TRINITY_DN10471_c0_g1~~TRINITY_DN10471_c0_g1_i1.p1  ORF type:complete len:183 (+),score=52.44 TRINITY_DN10471_c0_g1_i1:29-577(+)
MPGYHSEYNNDNLETICNMSLAPINTKFVGPAPKNPSRKEDIIDEAIMFFKANVLFRNYEVQGSSDRTLIYLTLFITEALKLIEKNPTCDIEQAKKEMYSLSINNFLIPGDKDWPLTGYTNPPSSRQESDKVRSYLAQLRQETGVRLCDKVFAENSKKASKWWLCFTKRDFMNKSLTPLLGK